MTQRTLALFYSPWPTTGLKRPSNMRPLTLYRYAVWYKANPRSADYMRKMLNEHIPEADWVDTGTDADWTQRLDRSDTIVLLFPDAIGLGWTSVERRVFAKKATWASVHVLNGRGRRFRLNAATRRSLRVRRLLAWTMIVELVAIPVFVVVTPVIWLIDAVRGHR